jgi:ZIP Zinc transporter.
LQVIIGFSVGLKLIQSDLSVKSVAQLDFWFSLMSPLGIGIAVGIDQYMRNMQDLLVMTGIMQGLATGTFIYVTFFEVLPKEIQSGEWIVFYLFINKRGHDKRNQLFRERTLPV